jgi:peptidoglycan/xylan/chitin deacetylase (PgdA/CDA1 family)
MSSVPSLSSHSSQNAAAEASQAPAVFVTFDVECSMGGAWQNPDLKPVPPSRAIWGEYDGGQLGLPLIVSILEECRLSATFFVEAFTDEQGFPGEMERVCHYLLDHGQDVQLHIHPNHKHYGLAQQGKPHPRNDMIGELEPDAQFALLQEGCERMERWTGKKPVAFRAGNMGASETTLEQLAKAGIPIDSSYTFPYAGGQCRFSADELYNGSKWYGEVLELALSGFRQPRLPGLSPTKPVDLVGISAGECVAAIGAIGGAGADTVLILHSFSLFKVRNVQYDGGRLNRIVTGRFRSVCRWLAEHREQCPVRTFAELSEDLGAGRYEAKAVPPFTLNRPMRALVRKGVQAFNNPYWT